MMQALIRAHRLLCSRFVSEDLFRAAIGAPRADVNAVAAYLALPVEQRPNVSLFFDPDFYRAVGEPLAAEEDPLLHFLDTGLPALRSPHPLIDLRYIVSRNRLILGETPSIGGLMDLLDYDLADPSPYFSLDTYASQFGGVQGAVPQGGMLRHFLAIGASTGLRGNAYFDAAFYATAYDDVPQDAYLATRHFILFGDAQARNPGADFDAAFYRARYKDAAASGLPPLLHYLIYGQTGRRETLPERPPVSTHHLPPGHPQPHDVETIITEDARMRAGVIAALQEKIDWVRAIPPAMITATAADLPRLRFPKPRAPRISVLIPAFNQFTITLECLLSLAAADLGAKVEIVLADDASTDPAMAQFADVPGLVVVRHAQNLGFLASCNAAFPRCRGAYVLLLNNDTQVMPGAIQALAAALDADPGLGAVGAKLLDPNGRLQEAGCFIRPDGSTGMVGLGADPNEGGFNRDRDVAYCSGAALMVRRSLIVGAVVDGERVAARNDAVVGRGRVVEGGQGVGSRVKGDAFGEGRVGGGQQLAAAEGEAKRRRMAARNQQTLSQIWGETLRDMDRIRVLAFFLPQFHPTPENDLWWGRGFTEWTNVARAQPSLAGQYQPHLPADLGYYDLRLPETLAAQAALAARYGVEGFVFYHYNFGTKRVLDRPLLVLLAHPEIALPFCLCWANENWTRHWDGGAREVLLEQLYDSATLDAVIDDAITAARDPRAITVDGKALFLVYRPLKLPDPAAFAATCRARFAAAGLAGVYLAYVESMEAVDAGVSPQDLGFDACVEFPPHRNAVAAEGEAEVIRPGWSGHRYDYKRTVQALVSRDSPPYPRHPAVFPSWDNTPRQPRHASLFEGASPEAFRVYVEHKIEDIRAVHTGDARLLFVNAWNEWAEGAHLEPDTGYGHRWLEALRAALDRMAWA